MRHCFELTALQASSQLKYHGYLRKDCIYELPAAPQFGRRSH
jgi:hypothetical protein